MSVTDLLEYTRQSCPELAAFIAQCCDMELRFDDPDALTQSAYNHVHLWALEYWADRHSWIDLEYKAEVVSLIIRRWRNRLKTLPPYRQQGYRLYFYQSLAPTLSVVAGRQGDIPYFGSPIIVKSRRDILILYEGQSWAAQFAGTASIPLAEITSTKLLNVINKNKGSIGLPSANQLGIKPGMLRKLIEQMGMARDVNDVRKSYHRRPANFRAQDDDFDYHIHVDRLPPNYR